MVYQDHTSHIWIIRTQVFDNKGAETLIQTFLSVCLEISWRSQLLGAGVLFRMYQKVTE